MHLTIHPIDLAVIITYLVGIVGIGVWAGLRRKKSGGNDYFLAGKSLTWPIIGLALFSTNISTIHLVSLAQEGYVNGLAYGNFEWMAIFTLVALALFFAPFYIRAKVATLPDFLEKRYSRPCRDFLAVISIISAVFIHIGFSLYTCAVVLRGLYGFDIMMSIAGITILTGIYTTIGGLLAVVLTESIQCIVLIAGAVVITLIGYHQVGGWEGLAASVDPVKLTILRPPGDPSGLPWYAVFLGYPVIGLWYWCADQTIVQRVLGAKDENHARIGPLFAGFIKILPVFIFVLPGLIGLGLVHQGKIATAPADSADIYALLINTLLPVGLKGLMAAALLAALMSTVSGALNSIATLASYDIWRRWRPDTPDRTLILIGRIVTVIAMIGAILWSPAVSHFRSIFQGVVAMNCYLAPPISVIFVAGVFWRRASSSGAITTLWAGFALGLAVFLLDWNKAYTGWNVPSMMAGFYLFVICGAVMTVVSLARPHIHTTESAALVWGNPLDALKCAGWRGIGDYRIIAGVLLVTIITLYVVFS
jgi:solute:Na+ symporter, SSS family